MNIINMEDTVQTRNSGIIIPMKDVDSFLNPSLARRAVITSYPALDSHRVDDVAKMLCVIAKNMYIKANSPDDVKQYVQEKMQKRNIVLKIERTIKNRPFACKQVIGRLLVILLVVLLFNREHDDLTLKELAITLNPKKAPNDYNHMTLLSFSLVPAHFSTSFRC